MPQACPLVGLKSPKKWRRQESSSLTLARRPDSNSPRAREQSSLTPTLPVVSLFRLARIAKLTEIPAECPLGDETEDEPMKSIMGKRAVGWQVLRLAAALLAVSTAISACSGGDEKRPAADGLGEAGARDGDAGARSGDAQAGASNGGASGRGDSEEAGSAPVAPGDLVCSTNADCTGDKPVCDPVQGCVACLYDWNCPANFRCDANQCFKKQACSDDAGCAHDGDRSVCDPVQGVCVGCREDSQCAAGERCAGSQCAAREVCNNSHACSAGKVCDRLLGACVACVVDGDCGEGNACVADACVPTCKSDKECLGIGLLCNQAQGRCVECIAHTDCPPDYYCGGAGACVHDVCGQGDSHCNGSHTLSKCSLVGDKFIESTCPSDTACQEDLPTASCAPLACAPGSVLCADDKGSVITCSADGLSVKSTARCGVGQACVTGECRDVVCPPGAFICDGSDLYGCDAIGTTKTKLDTCGRNFKCDEASGTCKPPTCSAGIALCDGNTPTTCADDGSGPLPGGTPCATGNACFNGLCKPIVCTGAYLCSPGGDLYKCSNNGTTSTFQNYCALLGLLCDAVAGKCITPKCSPNAFACDGTVATRCKADGSGYETGGTDCALQNMACDGGGCLPKACTPNATFCDGGNPFTCSAAGTTYASSDTCALSEYCDPSSRFCLTDKCTANAPVCNVNLLTTCNADGSGYTAGGTDCSATGQVCLAGACKAVVCTKGSLSCQGDAVYLCNDSGTGTTLYQTCALAQFCDASGEVAACATDVCSAGTLGCNQEVVSTCGANGGSWINPGTDCRGSGQVCVLGGSCAVQEVAVQGSTNVTTSAVGTVQFSAFRALTARKLTKLEIYASVSGLQKFTWVVYQKRTGSSIYDLVYQAVTAQTAAAVGWIASPILNYSFAAGKSYAVGVHITGTAQVGYASAFSDVYNAHAGFIANSFSASLTAGTQPPSSTTISSAFSIVPALRFTTSVSP